jgi:hypothetical protein
MTSSVDGQRRIEWSGIIQGDSPLLLEGGPIEQGQIQRVGMPNKGRPFVGTKTSDRETTEEDSAFGSKGVNGSGDADRPYESGLMADVVGVQWGGALAVEFLDGSS